LKTYIEISSRNLIHNLEEFRKLTGQRLMFVVKANAYGHGLKEVVSISRSLDFIDYYAVDSVEEALVVNSIDKHKKVLIIGWSDKDQIREILARDFEMVVPELDYLKQVEQIARQMKKSPAIHLKVETGTGRLGMPPDDVVKVCNGIPKSGNHGARVVGLYSHFANIEDTTDHSFARGQLEVFNRLLEQIDHHHILKHFSCSASALLFPQTHFDIVRVGISAYGFWPSKQTYISYIEQKKPPLELKPVLSWYSRVAQVKQLKKGDAIGYGLTYKTFDRARIVVIPVGYYDGYDRRLSNISTIMVNGCKAPVRGRICMDMFMADVTHIPGVKTGDPVILIGQHEQEQITADYLAEISGSINYEVVARLNPLIHRQVV